MLISLSFSHSIFSLLICWFISSLTLTHRYVVYLTNIAYAFRHYPHRFHLVLVCLLRLRRRIDTHIFRACNKIVGKCCGAQSLCVLGSTSGSEMLLLHFMSKYWLCPKRILFLVRFGTPHTHTHTHHSLILFFLLAVIPSACSKIGERQYFTYCIISRMLCMIMFNFESWNNQIAMYCWVHSEIIIKRSSEHILQNMTFNFQCVPDRFSPQCARSLNSSIMYAIGKGLLWTTKQKDFNSVPLHAFRHSFLLRLNCYLSIK